MIHECNVFCHSVESDLMELIGKDDSLSVGKWLPFAIDMSLVVALKMTTDDKESMAYRCSTVFLSSGDVYIIDTKFKDLIYLWKQAINDFDSNDDNDDITDSFNL